MKKNIAILFLCLLPLICFAQNSPAPGVSKEADPGQIYIPKDLGDCFGELKRKLPSEQIEEFKNNVEDNAVGYAHMEWEKWMKNNWGLIMHLHYLMFVSS